MSRASPTPPLHTALLLSLSLNLTTFTAIAAGESAALPLDELDTLPLVLTPSRLSQAIDESPAAVTIISRQKIEESGIREIPELFRLVPGMFVVYSSGQLPQVKYHGLDSSGNSNSRHLQVLIDGRSIYQSGFSRVLWSDIPLLIEDIERIEIVRSPSTVSHGTNAFLGVINIITRAPEDSTRLLALSGGSQQKRDFSFRHTAESELGHYRLSMKYHQNGGFDHHQQGKRDSQDLHFLNFRSDHLLTSDNQLEIDLGYKDGDKQEGSDTAPTVADWTSHHQQLRWIHDLDINHQSELTFYHQQRSIKHQWDSNSKDRNWDEERFHLELQYNQTHSDTLRSVSGTTLRQDRVKAPTYFGDHRLYKKNSHQLYTNLEWRPAEKWVLHGGIMWDHEDVGEISEFSPRAALNYHYTPNHTLRASYSRAIRSPDLLEQFATWTDPELPNTFSATAIASSRLNEFNNTLTSHLLQPEQITAHELGLHFHYPERRQQGNIKLYREELSNLTTLTLTDSTGTPIDANKIYPFTHSNLDWAEITGIELETSWNPTPRDSFSLSYAQIFSYHSNNRDLAHSSPKNIASTLFTHRFNTEQKGAIAFYYASSLCGYLDYASEPSGCSNADYTPPLRRLDLTLTQQLSASSRLQLLLKRRLGEQQLFNNQYSNEHSTEYRLTLSNEW